MAIALSPFPPESATMDRAAAIVRLKKSIEGRASYSDDETAGLGEAASAMIEREAPAAPQAVKDEATIRLAGYWAQSDYGGVESETSVGGKAASYFRPPVSAIRYSGVKAMLSPWKIRRAGVIK